MEPLWPKRGLEEPAWIAMKAMWRPPTRDKATQTETVTKNELRRKMRENQAKGRGFEDYVSMKREMRTQRECRERILHENAFSTRMHSPQEREGFGFCFMALD